MNKNILILLIVVILTAGAILGVFYLFNRSDSPVIVLAPEKETSVGNKIESVDFVGLFEVMCRDHTPYGSRCLFPEPGTLLRHDWDSAQEYPNSWWLEGNNKMDRILVQGWISNIEYLDLNNDGGNEAIISIHGGGTGGSNEFQVFKLLDSGGLIEIGVLRNKEKYEGARGDFSFKTEGGLIIEKFPVYHPEDANCCPSLGERSVGYQWVNGEIVDIGILE